MAKLRFGIVGVSRGSVFISALRASGAEVVAYCESNPKKRENLLKYHPDLKEIPIFDDYDEFIDYDMDAVILRALVYGQYSSGNFSDFVRLDPDAQKSIRTMLYAYEQYRYAYAVCLKARAIPRRPPLRSSIDPWYGGRFRDMQNTDAYWRAIAEVRQEYKAIREAQRDDKIEV